MKISKEDQNDMLFRTRSMIARIDGIWRICEGRYIHPLSNPWTAKVIVNGKDYIVCEFLDYGGYDETSLRAEVIARNIQSLPPAPKKKLPPFRRVPAQGMEWAFRMGNNGIPEDYQRPVEVPFVAPEPQANIQCEWVVPEPLPAHQWVAYEPPINL